MRQSVRNKMALVMVLAGSVSAGAHGLPIGPGSFDANNDGTLTPAEIEAGSLERVADLQDRFLGRYDSVPTGATEGDGIVTFEEAKAVFATDSAEWLERILERFDSDGDGRIPVAVKPGRGNRAGKVSIAEFDANDDGTVTKEELSAAAEAKSAERLAAFIEKYDSVLEGKESGDGTITEAEAVAVHAGIVAEQVENWLEKVDANDDGTVTTGELEAARKPRGRGDGTRGGPGGNR